MFLRIFTVPTVSLRQSNPINETDVSDIFSLVNENTAEANYSLQGALARLFTNHSPLDIGSFQKIRIFNALTSSNAWPGESTPAIPFTNVGQAKDDFLHVMNSLRDNDLKFNALMQSLCKQTFLGSVFHTQRHFGGTWTAPAVSSGRLLKVAEALEALIQGHLPAVFPLSDATAAALRAESQRNNSFLQSLASYPNLYQTVQTSLALPAPALPASAIMHATDASNTSGTRLTM